MNIIIMNKIFFTFLLVLLYSSCCTPKIITESIVETKVDSVFLKDTTILWQIKDSIVQSKVPDTDTSLLRTDIAESKAFVADGTLYHTLRNRHNVLVPVKTFIPITYRTRYISQTNIQEVNVLTEWQSFLIVMGKIFVGLIIIVLLVTFAKKKLL